MDPVSAYELLAPRFERWSKMMELQTRRMEVEEAGLGGAVAVIISPPTDIGIRLIAEANRDGITYLICWSKQLYEAAKRYSAACDANLLLLFDEPLGLPLDDASVDLVFANCLFDFCEAEQIDDLLAGIERILRPGGSLFAVYMGESSRLAARIWTGIFRSFPALSGGCRPVEISDAVGQFGFEVEKALRASRLGFPLRYLHARKE